MNEGPERKEGALSDVVTTKPCDLGVIAPQGRNPFSWLHMLHFRCCFSPPPPSSVICCSTPTDCCLLVCFQRLKAKVPLTVTYLYMWNVFSKFNPFPKGTGRSSTLGNLSVTPRWPTLDAEWHLDNEPDCFSLWNNQALDQTPKLPVFMADIHNRTMWEPSRKQKYHDCIPGLYGPFTLYKLWL